MRKQNLILLGAVLLILVNVPVYAGDAHSNFSPDDSRLVYMSDGVVVQACKACADLYGVSDDLSEIGIEVKYMG